MKKLLTRGCVVLALLASTLLAGTPASAVIVIVDPPPAGQMSIQLVAMAGSGWSDWGSPRRVFESLQGSQAHQQLISRIGDAGAAAA